MVSSIAESNEKKESFRKGVGENVFGCRKTSPGGGPLLALGGQFLVTKPGPRDDFWRDSPLITLDTR